MSRVIRDINDLVGEFDLSNLSRQELIELIELTQRWTDPMDHKFYLYKPNPIMEVFHGSPASTRALFGGNRSGKSYSLSMEFATTFTGQVPASIEHLVPPKRVDASWRQRLITIDYPNSFQKVIWPYMELLIPADKIVDVVKEQGRIKAITNVKGGFIEFMQCEQDVKKHQGSSRHRIGYDEEPPKSIRDENLMRLVDTNGEEIFSLTPVSEIDKPIIWIYDEIYEKASRIVEMDSGALTSVSLPEGNPDIHVFFANIYDNRAISKQAADRILSLFPTEERSVREKGKFLFEAGRVYKEFSDAHLIDPFDWWRRPGTLYLAIDTHPRTNTAVLFLWVDEKGSKFLVDELFIPLNTKPVIPGQPPFEEFVEYVKAKCMGVRVELEIIEPGAFIPDPSTGSCLAYDLMASGLDDPMPIAAPKDLANGIIRTKAALRERNLDGKPSFRIFRTLTHWRHEITHYVWDYYKKDTALTKGEKQKPLDKDDHFMECMYRLILMNPQYVPSMGTEDYDREPMRDFVGRRMGY